MLFQQVAVRALVRIDLGRRRGQIEHLDLFLVLFEPLFDILAVMHPQVIQDQKYLAFSILDEPRHELDEQL